MFLLPKLEANRVRKMMRIRVSEVFSPVRFIFGDSINLEVYDKRGFLGERERKKRFVLFLII